MQVSGDDDNKTAFSSSTPLFILVNKTCWLSLSLLYTIQYYHVIWESQAIVLWRTSTEWNDFYTSEWTPRVWISMHTLWNWFLNLHKKQNFKTFLFSTSNQHDTRSQVKAFYWLFFFNIKSSFLRIRTFLNILLCFSYPPKNTHMKMITTRRQRWWWSSSSFRKWWWFSAYCQYPFSIT